MNRFRPYRNDDPPALSALWNRTLPRSGAVRVLDPHEFDALIACKPGFDANGLIVAESDTGQILGFVHAGFGPLQPEGPSHAIDQDLGTIAMLVLDPDAPILPLGTDLIQRAEDYLRRKGAKVIYAGGQAPLNPFYWGVYGGSEYAGILSEHTAFRSSIEASSYQPVSTTILYEADLANLGTIRDPRAVLIRRLATLEVDEDAMLPSWWEAAAVGEARPNRFRLVRKADQALLASATTWEMLAFPPAGTKAARIGLLDVEVPSEHRRKGFGRHLIAEIMRKARGEWVDLLSVQTSETNEPARKLYESLNFEPVDVAVLYRKPGA